MKPSKLIQILLNGLILLRVLGVNSVAFVGAWLKTTRTNQSNIASLNISNRNLRDNCDNQTGGVEEAPEEADEENEGDPEED